ncbi:MAG: hypothetical protein IJU72_09630 [Bacteroidales bacterium]|nr:hypothetical protein [Bacteroidales bacterium]
MTVEQRIDAFIRLGDAIRWALEGRPSALPTAIAMAELENPWFTRSNIERMLSEIATRWLTPEALRPWALSYIKSTDDAVEPKRVGVVAAGNIPLVGFHDLLCVLVAGHALVLKPSSRDSALMKAIRAMLIGVEPQFDGLFELTEGQLRGVDAIIATGGDGMAHVMRHYFERYPSIIRQHRNAVALIDGEETDDELDALGFDIFSYFGLGCRNVSLLLIPDGYKMEHLLGRLLSWRPLLQHHKYANNYEYHRAIFALNREPHLDLGFALVRESEALDSPIGVLHYHQYASQRAAVDFLQRNAERIQCVVGNPSRHECVVDFGKAQCPSITDYADGVDTISFLLSL